MILRSRKKHRTTALTSRTTNPVKRAIWTSLALASIGTATAVAQQSDRSVQSLQPSSTSSLRVAKRFDASFPTPSTQRGRQQPSAQSTGTRQNTPLQWRTSKLVTPPAGASQPTEPKRFVHQSSVRQVVYQQPSDSSIELGDKLFGDTDIGPTTPVSGIPSADRLFNSPQGTTTAPSTNTQPPTGEAPIVLPQPADPSAGSPVIPGALQPPADPPSGIQPPQSAEPSGGGITLPDQLRLPGDPGTAEPQQPAPENNGGVQLPPSIPVVPADENSDVAPQPNFENQRTAPSIETPGGSGELQIPNPFKNQDNSDNRTEVPSDTEPTDPEETEEPGELAPLDRGFNIQPIVQRSDLSCQDLRDHVASRTIEKISLDISPAFRPDILKDGEYDEIRDKFLNRQEYRQWRGIEGELLGTGKLLELAFQNVIIETEGGSRKEIKVSQLSESDWAFLSSEWGLPRVCRIDQTKYVPRSWTPVKMTWSASGLCHNPLYFEEVQAERYGHSAGPWQQPLISTAHFFVNIATLPYKAGIHPPGECQYALGYYRPGNCAPYLLPPIPISLRGAVSQAAVVVGGIWLIP